MTKDDNRLIVIGAGGHSKIVAATVEAEARYRIVGLLDDDESKQKSTWYGYEVLGTSAELPRLREQGVSNVLVAVGDNAVRAHLAEFALHEGFELVKAIHPTAVILRGSEIGEGTVVLPLAFVGAEARVGRGALLSVGVMVAHDSVVGDWSQLCPGVRLGGHARVGAYSFFGMGATVLPRVSVGERAVIGANAAVIRNVPAGATAVGVPARIVNRMYPAGQPEPERS